jgi:hypothetical protein
MLYIKITNFRNESIHSFKKIIAEVITEKKFYDKNKFGHFLNG